MIGKIVSFIIIVIWSNCIFSQDEINLEIPLDKKEIQFFQLRIDSVISIINEYKVKKVISQIHKLEYVSMEINSEQVRIWKDEINGGVLELISATKVEVSSPSIEGLGNRNVKSVYIVYKLLEGELTFSFYKKQDTSFLLDKINYISYERIEYMNNLIDSLFKRE